MRLRIIEADPATVLIRAANRPGMDLVALGTQGANAMAQRLLGSVARKVLLHAKCDVLVVASAAMAAVTA